jgi:hypothetical protein
VPPDEVSEHGYSLSIFVVIEKRYGLNAAGVKHPPPYAPGEHGHFGIRRSLPFL